MAVDFSSQIAWMPMVNIPYLIDKKNVLSYCLATKKPAYQEWWRERPCETTATG
jgi:hypothetical protein